MRKYVPWLALAAVITGPILGYSQQKPSGTEPITTNDGSCITGTIDIDLLQKNDQYTGRKSVDIYKVNLQVAKYVDFEGKIERGHDAGIMSSVFDNKGKPPVTHYDYSVGVFPVSQRDGKRISKAGAIDGQIIVDGGYFVTNHAKASKKLSFVGQNAKSRDYSGRIKNRKAGSAMDKTLSKMTRIVNGKTYERQVKGQDPMDYNIVIGGGPWPSLQDMTVTGDFTYAFTAQGNNGFWSSKNGITMTYSQGQDKLTGSMAYEAYDTPKAVKLGKNDLNTTGSYEVSILVNEEINMAGGEEGMFKGTQAVELDEEEMFMGKAQTGKLPSIVGKIHFVDNIDERDGSGNSKAHFALDCKNVTQAQAVNFMKVYLMSIGPFHDDD